MIPNIGEQTVKMSRLEANRKQQEKFMERRFERLAYYSGDTEKITKEWFSENLLKNVPVGNINITKRIMDRTSEVYMIPAIRDFGSDAKDVKYREKVPRKDERMQRAERMTNLLEVVAIHPFIDVKKGIVDHAVIVDFEPFFDSAGDIVGIRYPLWQSGNRSATDERQFVEWGQDGWRVVDAIQRELRAEEYSGPFPFVFSWTEEPDYFYDHVPSGDLIAGNLAINFYQTLMNANMAYQSFGQPYVTGMRSDDVLEWGVDKVPTLPEGAGAGILSPPSTVGDVVEAQRHVYKMIARNYHLPEDFVEGSAQAESGVAIRLRNQELQNERVGDVVRFRNVERDLWVIERYLLSTMGVSMPDAMSVDFSESVEYLSAQEQRERDEWDLDHNLITVAQIAHTLPRCTSIPHVRRFVI